MSMISEGPKNLFFNKSGEAVFGRVKPTAFAWNSPWPPGSTNINKNKVYRPSSEETTRFLEDAKENLEREANVSASICPIKYAEDEEKNEKGEFRRRIRVPDIELAIYWDRNPYRQRVVPNQSLLLSKQRSKSAANVSCLKELLDYSNLNGNGEKGSENSQRNAENRNGKEIHKEGCPAAESSRASISKSPEQVSAPEQTQPSENSNRNNGSPPKLDKDNENSREKKSRHESRRQSSSVASLSGKEDVDIVKGTKRRNRITSVGDNNKSPLEQQSSFEEEINPENSSRAVGVQVSSDKISLAEFKSILLCPVHGQLAENEKRLREKNFRERLATAVHPDNMSCSRCSRHHSRSRARTASCSTTGKRDKSQTEESERNNLNANNGTSNHQKKPIKASRSKTAKSEYAGNFRNPTKLSPSYNRQLRNKILSYCFTKQSVF